MLICLLMNYWKMFSSRIDLFNDICFMPLNHICCLLHVVLYLTVTQLVYIIKAICCSHLLQNAQHMYFNRLNMSKNAIFLTPSWFFAKYRPLETSYVKFDVIFGICAKFRIKYNIHNLEQAIFECKTNRYEWLWITWELDMGIKIEANIKWDYLNA